MDKEIFKINSKLITDLKNIGKSSLKSDKNLKKIIKDIKNHYEKVGSYPLSYSTYRSFLNYPDVLFNIILDLSGFTVRYNKKSFNLEIVKKREGSK